ncbi:MAG: NAD(P)-binding protein [bacterium]|nr:NAD(P)-binding protein [bacterium]
MTERFDAVVIGAGLSGLGVGALLAKAGKRVVVLEKTKQIGGRATSFKYKDYTLNIGEHAGLVGGRIDDLIMQVGKEPPARGIFDDMKIYDYKKHQAETIANLAPIGNPDMLALYNAVNEMTPAKWKKADGISAKEWLAPIVKDKVVRDLWHMCAIVVTTIARLEDMAASSFIESIRLILRSTTTFLAAQGIGDFSRVLADSIRERNGEVRTGAKVSRILIEKKHVTGVLMEPDEESPDGAIDRMVKIEAPIVVTAFPVWEVLNLLDEGIFPPAFIKKAKNLNKLTYNLGFAAGMTEPLYTENMFIMTQLPRTKYPGTIFMASNLAPTLAPPGQHLLECSAIVGAEVASNREKLLKSIQLLKDDLNEMYPGWEKKALWVRPYFHFEEPARAPKCDGIYKPGPKAPKIVGLYFTGDSVNSRTAPGMECASDSAMICAEAILGKLP